MLKRTNYNFLRKTFMKLNKLSLILCSALGSVAFSANAEIPENLKFCNLSNSEAQIKIVGRKNADIEVDGGHGPNTKMDIQMGSGQCKNIHVLYEHTDQSRSHTEITLQVSEKKDGQWKNGEKFNINSDPWNLSKYNEGWSINTYSRDNSSELHVMFPAIEGGYYNQNYSQYTKLGNNQFFDVFKHNGGRDVFKPYPSNHEQILYLYAKRLNNLPAQEITNFIDLNYSNAFNQIKANNKTSFFYPLMGLTDKAKYSKETTTKVHNNERFNLTKVCDINYELNENITPETKVELSKFEGTSASSEINTVATFTGNDHSPIIEFTPEFKKELTTTNTTTNTSTGSLQIGYKFKQSGGFKLVANAELSYEGNFKMASEKNVTTTNKTITNITLPRMEVVVPPNKIVTVTAQIEEAKFSGKFVTRYPVKNTFARVIMNKPMSTSCDDADYLINVSDMMKFNGLSNNSIFSASESTDTLYVEDKFNFTSVAGYKLIVKLWEQPKIAGKDKRQLMTTNKSGKQLIKTIEIPFDAKQNKTGIKLELKDGATQPSKPKVDKNLQINPFKSN